MEFSNRYAPDTTREDAKLIEKEWELDAKELEDEHSPSEDEINAVAYGLTMWTENLRYGTPREGGHLDQPMNWRLAMDVVHRAHSQAERDSRFDEAAQRERS